jgi:hypothetical protein
VPEVENPSRQLSIEIVLCTVHGTQHTLSVPETPKPMILPKQCCKRFLAWSLMCSVGNMNLFKTRGSREVNKYDIKRDRAENKGLRVLEIVRLRVNLIIVQSSLSHTSLAGPPYGEK